MGESIRAEPVDFFRDRSGVQTTGVDESNSKTQRGAQSRRCGQRTLIERNGASHRLFPFAVSMAFSELYENVKFLPPPADVELDGRP